MPSPDELTPVSIRRMQQAPRDWPAAVVAICRIVTFNATVLALIFAHRIDPEAGLAALGANVLPGLVRLSRRVRRVIG